MNASAKGSPTENLCKTAFAYFLCTTTQAVSKIVPSSLSPYQRAMTGSTEKPALPHVAALIVAAGRGTRMGGNIPKQYQPLMGRPVLMRTIETIAAHPSISEIVVVRHPDDSALFELARPAGVKLLKDVAGGATRDASVRAGLASLGPEVSHVLIHDGARPLVSHKTIDAVLAALEHADGAAPGLAITDALWLGDTTVTGTYPRDGLFRAQTPQGFRLTAIRDAHAAATTDAADDVEVAMAHGIDVTIVAGDEANIKLTRPADFERAEAILERQKMMDIRTGNGFDVHRFGAGDHVMLAGIRIPHSRGLQGHSDADVGLHTVTDAIYGALAMGDIGTHFPPSDPQWKGAESHIFLTHAVEMASEMGFALSNVDLTFMCERPKIGPRSAAMRAQLATLLKIDQTRVSVKATTTERLGFTGREEGIAAMATVTLVKE